MGEQFAARGAGGFGGFGKGIAELAQLGGRQRLAARQSGTDSGNEAIAVEEAGLAEGGIDLHILKLDLKPIGQ